MNKSNDKIEEKKVNRFEFFDKEKENKNIDPYDNKDIRDQSGFNTFIGIILMIISSAFILSSILLTVFN